MGLEKGHLLAALAGAALVLFVVSSFALENGWQWHMAGGMAWMMAGGLVLIAVALVAAYRFGRLEQQVDDLRKP